MGHTATALTIPVDTAVHPHIRGAYLLPFPRAVKIGGSSPHTWGIRVPALYTQGVTRFIPTYVGHTISCLYFIGVISVHPHIRGAYIQRIGSSLNIVRFIPTYVGHTSSIASKPFKAYGSSPHTWGIHGISIANYARGRLIPTYVGHTLWGGPQPPPACGSSPHTWGIPIRFLTWSWV